MVQDLRVLFLTAEAAPLVQVGGLGDMAGSLPGALQRLSLDVRVALPLYPWLDLEGVHPGPKIEMQVPGSLAPAAACVREARLGGVPLWLIDGSPIAQAQSVYSEPALDAPRFLFFVRAALEACRSLGWAPDVVHANDWHTAPAAVALAHRRSTDPFWSSSGSLVTIHNLPYLGVGGEPAVHSYGWAREEDSRLPEWARALPLAVGLSAADRLSTVSPTYAEEIQTPEFGSGLQEFIRGRAADLTGILNGIDTARWDPQMDQALAAPFSSKNLAPRRRNKSALRKELGLPDPPRTPLVAMITRLDPQKGVDLALETLPDHLTERWDFVLLGAGSPGLERASLAFAAEHGERARVRIGFDPGLARRLYAAADLILIPSRYEPCGVAQMIAMRYGCLPLVRATGGLKDTVTDAAGRAGTGFVFGPADPAALSETLGRALRQFSDRKRWLVLQRRAMAKDFSWARSARAYRDLYRTIRDRPAAG